MKNTVKQIIKKVLGKAVARPVIIKHNEAAPEILKNVFNAGYKKKVLISYIMQPFIEGIKYHHTNYLECHTAAEVFHELGYAVDVVDLFNDSIRINYSEYEVVYGLGIPLEKSFYVNNPGKLMRIMYSTGCNPFFSYKESALAVQRFYAEKKLLVPQSSRISHDFWTFQYVLSDLVIALGNNFVANTFKKTNPSLNCVSVPAFYFKTLDVDIKTKDFSSAKKNFLWFGSAGLLHKGLDLLLDVFLKRNDIKLHICGYTNHETEFWEYYTPLLEQNENIVNHGFVDIHSEDFKSLMQTTAFCIFPTASEGGSPAMLNIMANGGLIPIASEACGIDIKSFGFQLENISRECIEISINTVLGISENELMKRAGEIKYQVQKDYSYDLYKANILSEVEKVLKINKL